MKTISVQNQIVSEDVVTSFSTQDELFDRYVKPYSNMIYWICIKYSASRYYIEDNHQEVLIILYKYIHTYNPERGSIKTWLYAVVSRAVKDLNARNHRKPAYEYDLSLIAGDFYFYDVETSQKSDYLTNYRLLFTDDILWALDQLISVYREALLLHLSGYGMREIVQISYLAGNLESKNIETVKARLYMARKHMRRMIDENGNKRRVKPFFYYWKYPPTLLRRVRAWGLPPPRLSDTDCLSPLSPFQGERNI